MRRSLPLRRRARFGGLGQRGDAAGEDVVGARGFVPFAFVVQVGVHAGGADDHVAVIESAEVGALDDVF